MSAMSETDFVDLAAYAPALLIEPRYSGSDNFLGRPANGYRAPRCLLSRPAAAALARANGEAASLGLRLKVFDGYRPQQAVDDFLRWTLQPADPHTQAAYHPRIEKRDIVPQGYISAKSSHSRGSAVDLTFVRMPGSTVLQAASTGGREGYDFLANGELDMGGTFDLFDVVSRMDQPEVPPQFMLRRRLLQSLMESAGFQGIQEEWWHFHLADEPYPLTYFDFPIETLEERTGQV